MDVVEPSAVSEAAAEIVSAAVEDATEAQQAAQVAVEAAREAGMAVSEVETTAHRLVEETQRRAAEEISNERVEAHVSAAESIAEYEERVLSLENRADAAETALTLLREDMIALRLSTPQPSMETLTETKVPSTTEAPAETQPEALSGAGEGPPVVEKPERKKHRFL
jgi:hypothetical protein